MILGNADADLKLAEALGTHLADCDEAIVLRTTKIDPIVDKGASLVLDFTGVRHANSSFVNALLTGLIEEHGEALLERLTFCGCNPILRVLVQGAVELGVEKHDRRARA